MSALALFLRRHSRYSRLTASTAILAIISFTLACGSSMSQPSPPQFSGNTQVSMVLTSTANDELVEYDMAFSSISLTSQSGTTATLLPASVSGNGTSAEFMHVNGNAEPLLAATIPQGIYTSATATLADSEFSCVALGTLNGEQTISSAFYSGNIPTVTVDFPSPITVTGNSMALSLDLLVSQSATIGSCLNVDGFTGFAMTPTFTLTQLPLLSVPTNSSNGKITSMDGQVAAIDAAKNTFTLSVPTSWEPRKLSITAVSGTVYQGITAFSALASGAFVNMDGTLQPDGSVQATRITVQNTSTVDMLRGPLLEVTPSVSGFFMHAREQQGKGFPFYVGGFGYANYGTASFQVSGQFSNLRSLPFTPSFSPSSIVPGQEVYLSVDSMASHGYANAATVTLMPQTINGTVLGSSQVGKFTDYTVSLASYDLFPMMAVQPYQTNLEVNPSQVEVYVDGNTQLLAAQPLGEGSNYRFYGLVFDDNGTLRMDCAQASDGVALQPQSSVSHPAQIEEETVRQVRMPGNVRQIITTNSPLR